MADGDQKARQEVVDMWRIYRTTKEMCRDRVGAFRDTAHSPCTADPRV